MKRGWRNILFSLTSVLILSFNGITVFGDVRVVAEGENSRQKDSVVQVRILNLI